MSMITEQIKRLKNEAGLVECTHDYTAKLAADTIKVQSAKIHAYAMERSTAYYNGGWIPVSERLPEDRREVLVTAYWHETYQVMMGSYYGDGLWWCVPFNNCGEHMQKLKPKAWIPLPEPYREDGETE